MTLNLEVLLRERVLHEGWILGMARIIRNIFCALELSMVGLRAFGCGVFMNIFRIKYAEGEFLKYYMGEVKDVQERYGLL